MFSEDLRIMLWVHEYKREKREGYVGRTVALAVTTVFESFSSINFKKKKRAYDD